MPGCCRLCLQRKRYALLGAFAFAQGTSLGPLVGAVLQINPALLLTAAMSTTAIFACFSLSALFTKRRWVRQLRSTNGLESLPLQLCWRLLVWPMLRTNKLTQNMCADRLHMGLLDV